jgi:phosphatidylglycerophosphatase A
MSFPPMHVRAMPAFWLASGGGVGLAPFAAGTFGSIAALLPWLLLRELPPLGYAAVVGLVFAVGGWAAQRVIVALRVEDPGFIVIDEFVGLWVALCLVPPGWGWVLVGFGLFRLFDIWKPWPVSWADRRVKGGWGTMLDDVLAGAMAWGSLQLLAWLLSR